MVLSLHLCLTFLIDHLLYLLCIDIWVGNYLIVDLLITGFAEASRMMSAIGVVTFRCLALVTLGQVAEVAHEFGPVLAVIVLANVEEVEVVQNVLEVTKWLVVQSHVEVITFIIKLL